MAAPRRILRTVLLGLLVPEAAYLLAAHAVLDTPLRDRVFNRRPDKFRIAWSFGFTPWPGLVFLHGVETAGRSRAIEWSATRSLLR